MSARTGWTPELSGEQFCPQGAVLKGDAMSDKLLEEANRAAHRGMRALINTLGEEPWTRVGYSSHFPELVRAMRDYEEIDRRAKPEATR